MNSIMKIFLYFMILFSSTTLFSQNVILSEIQYHIDIDKSLNETTAYAKRKSFVPLTHKNNSLGFRNVPIWLYAKVKNETDHQKNIVIEFVYPLHDFISVYDIDSGKITLRNKTGDLTPFKTREIAVNNFAIPYTLDAGMSKEMLYKIDSHSSLNIGIKVIEQEKYYQALAPKNIFLGLYYGAVLIMLIYNFILYLIIKEKVYLYYVLFHLFHFTLQLGLNGLAFEYFYPNIPWLNIYFIPIVFSLANFYAIEFMLYFLALEKYFPRVTLALQWFRYVFIMTFVFAFFVPYEYNIVLITLGSIINILSLFLISLYLLYRYRTMAAKFFVLAWSFLFIGGLSGELQNIGLLHMSSSFIYAPQVGAALELALLSFALAYRYNTLFVKLTKTEEALQVLNKELEDKVEQRTADLDSKNQELSFEINNKNILFKELYHRVKNNLQIISGLLSLQLRRIKQKESREILKDTNLRIKSMAMIHERLYQSDDLTAVDMQEYTHDLISELKRSLEYEDIHFNIECDKIKLSLEVAVPMGLIINELVTNGIKYAFTLEKIDKNMSIKMYINDTNNLILEVSDNGKGIIMDDLEEGFGFKLVQSLAVYQLKGESKIFNQEGLHHQIIFPKEVLL